jgi:hypothetical protein
MNIDLPATTARALETVAARARAVLDAQTLTLQLALATRSDTPGMSGTATLRTIAASQSAMHASVLRAEPVAVTLTF